VGPVCAWLYVPASRATDLLEKACRAADGVILDLEDATHPADRGRARNSIIEALTGQHNTPIEIRINAVGSPDFDADVALLETLLGMNRIQGVRLPKVERPADVLALTQRIEAHNATLPLTCLIESAIGASNIESIAQTPGVTSVMLGESDLRADLRLPRMAGDEIGLLHIRQRLVLASVAAGLGSPSGSVFANIKDMDGLRESCATLRSLGFWGRSCIHPSQVDVVREAFRPTADEVAWAEQVLTHERELAGELSAAGSLGDGSFIDPAITRQAQDIMNRWSEHVSRGD
jgi:citrate lyase subunit beta / citryl-CoA lyase